MDAGYCLPENTRNWIVMCPYTEEGRPSPRNSGERVIEELQIRERQRTREVELIESAGLRKHLSVWRPVRLSDPAHIRGFPCLR